MLKMLVGGGVCIVLLTPASLFACPYCESDVGRQVAAGIFNEDFGYNALLTLLPFPVLLFIVALIHFGVPWPRHSLPETGATENCSRSIED